MNLIDHLSLVRLNANSDPNGMLVVAEEDCEVPFPIRRFFSVSKVAPGTTRGGHAHRQLNQLLICLSGRIEVVCDDGNGRKTFMLDDPATALLVPSTIWAEQTYLEPHSVLGVLCDAPYDEADYLRDYQAFLAFRKAASAHGKKADE